MPLLIVCYAPKNVYNMDEKWFILSCPTKQDTSATKGCGRNIQKDPITLFLEGECN